MEKILIAEMSWTEYRDYASKEDMIILPVGVTEEHGYHNPLGTDTLIAAAAAKKIGEQSGIAVAPALPMGVTPGVVDFAGSISIDPMLYRKVLMAYAESYLKTGIKRILFINGHGGNDDVLNMVCMDLYKKHKAVVAHTEWWHTLPASNPEITCADHGGHFETSMMLAVQEDTVNMEEAKDCPAVCELTAGITYAKGWSFKGASLNIPVSLYKVQKVGNCGLSPLKANKELGQIMVDKYVDYNLGLIKEMKKISF